MLFPKLEVKVTVQETDPSSLVLLLAQGWRLDGPVVLRMEANSEQEVAELHRAVVMVKDEKGPMRPIGQMDRGLYIVPPARKQGTG